MNVSTQMDMMDILTYTHARGRARVRRAALKQPREGVDVVICIVHRGSVLLAPFVF